MERLDKIISATGKKSRREVREMVRQGRVLVDGKPAPAADMKVDPQTAVILLDGEPLGYEKFTYVMLHKPAGVLTATEDRRQETVLDLLPPELRRRALSPVGRLDKDTEGLLLLTNDGQLAHRLLSPKSHVDKVYYARVDGALEPGDIAAFAAGMTLGDGLECLPAGLEILSPTEALVTLREGKFHQVKRMLAARGKPVLYLKRLSMGRLRLDPALAPGAWRMLTEEERSALNLSLSETLLDRTTKNEERIL
ncbi:MAG: 16S rRNA pseudouridine(516) synthase [Firmicutes bacterium]|nr:16S rRNA pseudouridine(516) synthase [Bacillota bacterium]